MRGLLVSLQRIGGPGDSQSRLAPGTASWWPHAHMGGSASLSQAETWSLGLYNIHHASSSLATSAGHVTLLLHTWYKVNPHTHPSCPEASHLRTATDGTCGQLEFCFLNAHLCSIPLRRHVLVEQHVGVLRVRSSLVYGRHGGVVALVPAPLALDVRDVMATLQDSTRVCAWQLRPVQGTGGRPRQQPAAGVVPGAAAPAGSPCASRQRTARTAAPAQGPAGAACGARG